MSPRHELAIAAAMVLLGSTGCASDGGSKHAELCRSYCDRLISELDDCVVQATGCHVDSKAYGDYMDECRGDCVAGFDALSDDEESEVVPCVECLCATVEDPACGQLAAVAEEECDPDCDQDNLDELNDDIDIPDPEDADLDC